MSEEDVASTTEGMRDRRLKSSLCLCEVASVSNIIFLYGTTCQLRSSQTDS